MMRINLSYEEYAAWCKSRFPAIDPSPAPESFAKTELDVGNDTCPVTVRSVSDDCVVVTPRPKGSR